MNRRSFLKRCGLIPFIGSLAVGVEILKSGPPGWTAFPDSNLEVSLKIFNGQVFEAPWPLCHTVIVQYFGEVDKWLLLSEPYESAQHGGSGMMVCHYGRNDGGYNPFYTQRELQEKLTRWKLVKSKLILDERIYP